MEAWDQPYNASEQKKNAALSKEMFVHAFNSYMSYGFPQDNVRPQSCRPSNSQVPLCLSPFPYMITLTTGKVGKGETTPKNTIS